MYRENTFLIIRSTARCYYVGMRYEKHGRHYFGKLKDMFRTYIGMQLLKKRPLVVQIVPYMLSFILPRNRPHMKQ